MEGAILLMIFGVLVQNIMTGYALDEIERRLKELE